MLLHKKVGDTLREGDVMFTVFAEVGGSPTTPMGTRRVIERRAVDVACSRIMAAYTFNHVRKASFREPLIRYFVGRDGTVRPA